MYFPFYIASRWTHSTPQKHTRHILRLGVACIALCMSIMIIAICILVGFKDSISQKVFGFGSHLQIRPYSTEGKITYLELSNPAVKKLAENKHIKHLEPFLYKEGLLKGEEESLGVFFKGISPQFDTSFFAKSLIEGRLPHFEKSISSEIIISEKTARLLDLKIGGKARTYFISDNYLRPRAFNIVGIYKTGLAQFDATYILGDIRQIQRLDSLSNQQVSGLDISLYNPNERLGVKAELSNILPYEWSCYSCDELFPEIFDWLALIDINVWVLMIIIWTVAIISLISILFICVIGRRSHAAMLGVMGAGRRSILNIFMWQAVLILGKGMVIGNACGLLVCLIQHLTHAFKLNEDVYFLSFVPTSFPWSIILIINVLCIAIALIVLFLAVLGLRRKYSVAKELKRA